MEPAALQHKLDSIPKVSLASYPTPLEPLARLSERIERPLWVKRDDQLGPGLGGNKVRKLEYLLAEAQALGARKVVTFGGLQSNHACLTAAAAARCGLEAHLFYFEPRPARREGNLALNTLFGAHLHFIPLGGSGNGMTLETTIRLVRLLAWLRLGPHYFIPVGGHSWLGCLGYVQAALEIDRQARLAGIADAWLVAAAGSGGTLAGLMAGLALCGSPLRLVGIDVGKLWKAFPASIARLAQEICTRLGEPHSFTPAQVPLIEAAYVGPRYGQPSPAGIAALRLAAHLEGLILDPVYTAKAFAGLLDLAERARSDPSGQGLLAGSGPIIFLHTGGAPALFTSEARQALQ